MNKPIRVGEKVNIVFSNGEVIEGLYVGHIPQDTGDTWNFLVSDETIGRGQPGKYKLYTPMIVDTNDMKYIFAYSFRAQYIDPDGNWRWTRRRLGNLDATDTAEAIGKATEIAHSGMPSHKGYCNWTVGVHPIPRSHIEYAAYHYYGMRHPTEQDNQRDMDITFWSNVDTEVAEEIEEAIRSILIGKGLEARIHDYITDNDTTTDLREDEEMELLDPTVTAVEDQLIPEFEVYMWRVMGTEEVHKVGRKIYKALRKLGYESRVEVTPYVLKKGDEGYIDDEKVSQT